MYLLMGWGRIDKAILVSVIVRAAVRIGDTTTCQDCGQRGRHTTGSGDVFIGG